MPGAGDTAEGEAVVGIITREQAPAGEDDEGTRILTFSVAGDGSLSRDRTYAAPGLCPANDLDWLDPDHLVVSLDREACAGLRRFAELALGLSRGRVIVVDLDGKTSPQEIARDLAFPNGIAVAPGDAPTVHVAVSREQALLSFRREGGSWRLVRSIGIDGGPDNLAWDAVGNLLAAVHPDLFRFGLYSMRVPGFDSTPTRLVRIAPDGGVTGRDIGDAGGRFDGATDYVLAERLLVAGAAFDDGLLVCRTGHGG